MSNLNPIIIRHHGETYWLIDYDIDGYHTLQHVESGDLHAIYLEDAGYDNIVSQIESQRIYHAILRERAYQDRKYGTIAQRNMPLNDYILIAYDELDESSRSFRSGDLDNARCELLQVAAVAIAALEAHGLVERDQLTDPPIPNHQSPITAPSAHNKRLSDQ
jgi:hypothetical protein